MIRIVQISRADNDSAGDRLYEVGINNHPAIATFMHRRSDGLAACLAKASSAVEKAEREKIVGMYEALTPNG